MKPSPADFQERYLDSLRRLGLDPLEHDVRFVEDNWESPTLGAWGLGWEVWLNGMEVSQFTYFQQAGGLECLPVTGEITYGIERLAMYLQDVDSVYASSGLRRQRAPLSTAMFSIKTKWKCRRSIFSRQMLITYLDTSNFAKRKLSDWFPSNCHFRPMSSL